MLLHLASTEPFRKTTLAMPVKLFQLKKKAIFRTSDTKQKNQKNLFIRQGYMVVTTMDCPIPPTPPPQKKKKKKCWTPEVYTAENVFQTNSKNFFISPVSISTTPTKAS